MKRGSEIDGVRPSRVQLPPGEWRTVLEALCARFATVDEATWLDRFSRGRVLDASGRALDAGAPYRLGAEIHYFREVPGEAELPVLEQVVYADEHLLVVDKPHFLPVVPAGRFARQTLLARLTRRFAGTDLAPLHRIDRLTAGLVLFSCNPASRARYQAVFRERRIRKCYEALAAPCPALSFPRVCESRIERGDPFFRMRVVPGEPNALTRIDVIEMHASAWHYALEPVTGRKHQLRVHMAALGAPIVGDPLYPHLRDETPDDFSRPLQLLARALEFQDPLDGRPRRFESGLQLSLQATRLSEDCEG